VCFRLISVVWFILRIILNPIHPIDVLKAGRCEAFQMNGDRGRKKYCATTRLGVSDRNGRSDGTRTGAYCVTGVNCKHGKIILTNGLRRRSRFIGVIEVNENVAGIALIGIGQKIYVITLLVTGAQKAHHRSTPQLTGIPQSLSRARLSCGAVNQADEVERIRHGRELAADSVPGKKESAIEHGDENAIETPRNYNVYSADGNSPLNSVSQSRGAPHFCRLHTLPPC
jgi:hypothetical protein